MQVIAVVPIFVSAGAAVLPTIVAAVAGVAAILLKPRELLRVCRARPVAAGVSVLTVVMALGIGTWVTEMVVRGNRGTERVVARFDWAKVAEDLIAQERAGKIPTALGGAGSGGMASSSPTPENPASNIPSGSAGAGLAIKSDFTRSSYDGGRAPTGLGPLWSFRPDDTMFLAKPVVAGNRIFAAGCEADLGGYLGLLACLDAETGKPLWKVEKVGGGFLKAFFSSPSLSEDGNYLVIGQGLHEDRDCSLLCFETDTGKLHWAVKTPLHIESSPAIFGDMAVVGAGAIEGQGGRPTGDPGFVLAVRISDGKELWRQAVNDPESSPAIDENGMVYIGSGLNGSALVALRSESDEQLLAKKLDRIAWKTAVAQPVTGEVTLAGDLVIAGAGNGDFVHSQQDAQGLVIALDRKTGAVRWQTPVADSVLGAIAYRDGKLICPSRTGEVIALAADTGKELWRARVSGTAPVLAGSALTKGRVYAVSSDGYLAVIDANNGTILEKLHLNDQAKPGNGLGACTPQIVAGRVIVGSETGGLRCLTGTGGGE